MLLPLGLAERKKGAVVMLRLAGAQDRRIARVRQPALCAGTVFLRAALAATGGRHLKSAHPFPTPIEAGREQL
jgi:hypothetical protein